MTPRHPSAPVVAVEQAPSGDVGLAWRWRLFRSVAGRGLAPVPVAFVRGATEDALFVQVPAGHAGDAVEHRVDVVATVAEMARTLGALHATSIPGGPAVDAALRARGAARRLRAGEVAPATMDPAYAHLAPGRLADRLEAGIERHAVAGGSGVVVGRPALAQLRLAAGRATGFVDWTRSGRGDPHLDLAVAARSVARLSPHLVPELIRHYPGSHPDLARLDWYQLLTGVDP